MSEFYLEVFGVPAPKGSVSAFIVARKDMPGRFRAVITHGKKSKEWEEKVRRALSSIQGVSGPLVVELWFWMPRPGSVTRPYPSVVPDIDKLVRAVLDGAKEAIEDDSRVVDLIAHERYSNDEIEAGMFMRVWEKEDDRDAELVIIQQMRLVMKQAQEARNELGCIEV